ncbi:MAG: endonuclease III [Victivallales bacterium]|nr:endonuclease III [Victivallales bacterium]
MPRRSSEKEAAALALEVYRRLFAVYGECRCTLDYRTPHQLLVATILSAQCTDRRVNMITPALFRRYPEAAAFAAADRAELEELIRPAGFFRHKAESIIGSSREIMARFAGRVPATMAELVTLPGVGRKTANVILGDAFEVPGFPVDTHVNRVLNRIGLVAETTPEKIERRINALMPASYWTNFSHLLILHGRETCQARRPACSDCGLHDICAFGRKKKD